MLTLLIKLIQRGIRLMGSYAQSPVCILGGIFLVSLGCTSPNYRLRGQIETSYVIVFRNVHVLPMHEEMVLRNQTVLVRSGTIAAIAEAKGFRIPPEAKIIEGEDKYLMPGLCDMHAHLGDENDLILLLANGVTTVRVMGESPWWAKWMGFPNMRRLRDKINQDRLLGPRLYTAGLILEGEPRVSPMMKVVESPEEGRKAVREQASRGYDFIKVYDHLSPEVFNEIIDEADQQGLPVVGHVPKKVPLHRALRSGIVSIEHLTGYIDNDLATFVIPEEEMEEYARQTREAGVWNCPTLVLFDKVVPPDQFERIERLREMKYMSWRTHFWWRQTLKAVYKNEYQGDDYPQHVTGLMQRMAKALSDAGARLLIGTDANFVGVFPGFAVHRELELLVDTGISPYEALRAGTYHAAVFLGKEEEFGSVQVGRTADLLLLEGNPLEDIEYTQRLCGVMVRGKWLPEETLRSALASIAE